MLRQNANVNVDIIKTRPIVNICKLLLLEIGLELYNETNFILCHFKVKRHSRTLEINGIKKTTTHNILIIYCLQSIISVTLQSDTQY